jgi:adenosylhomocysteine nucleosidase
VQIAIICAIEEERAGILYALNIKGKKSAHKYFDYYVAKYNEIDLILGVCGIGKVNAASLTQHLIDKFNPNYVINVGVAGGLASNLKFGDVVIATELIHHDMDATTFGIPFGQVPRMDVFAFQSHPDLVHISTSFATDEYKIVKGRVVTGDQFIDDKDKANYLKQTFNASACEMEGAAIAQVCHINTTPFLVVRALSDMAGLDNSAKHSYLELKEMVSKRSSMVIKYLLDELSSH